MNNFVGLRFCDNDFHVPLMQAAEFVNNTHDALNMTASEIAPLVVTAMFAYHLLRCVEYNRIDPDVNRLLDYFAKKLTVLPVQKLEELGDNFEGYVIGRNQVFYQGY